MYLPKELVGLIIDYKRQFEICQHVDRMWMVNAQIKRTSMLIRQVVKKHVANSWRVWQEVDNTRTMFPLIYSPGGSWEREMKKRWWLNACLKCKGRPSRPPVYARSIPIYDLTPGPDAGHFL